MFAALICPCQPGAARSSATLSDHRIDRRTFMDVGMLSRLGLLALLLLTAACAANQAPIELHGEPQREIIPIELNSLPPYIIDVGDGLEIKFFHNPELNETIAVRPDGKISLQLLDDVQAAGLTPSELDTHLTTAYSTELKNPVVSVIVRSFSAQRVYVAGEVNRQGPVDLKPGMTALEAVIKAEGLKETGKPEGAIIIRKGPSNRPYPIPVDLRNALYGNTASWVMPLQPNDVVYVPKTFIAEANKFVNQYIERLLLFRGVSLGFSYELRDGSSY